MLLDKLLSILDVFVGKYIGLRDPLQRGISNSLKVKTDALNKDYYFKVLLKSIL